MGMTKLIRNGGIYKARKGFAAMIVTISVTALLGVIGLYAVLDYQKSQKEGVYNIQGDLAFQCADSAVEIGANCIENALDGGSNPTTCAASTTVLDSSVDASCVFDYTVSEITTPILFPILTTDITEIVLVDGSSTSLDVSWKTDFSAGNVLEINLYEDTGGGTYDLIKQYDYSCEYSGGSFIAADYPVDSDPHCELPSSIDLTTDSFALIQITPRYERAIELEVSIGGDTPIQGYMITANGDAGTVGHTLQAAYMLKNLARVFNATFYANEVVD